MSGAVKIDSKGFEELSKDLEKINGEVQWFIVELANEIAARLLRKVIKRTPVGDYSGDIKRYKRNNKKKGIKKGDIVYTKTGKVKREKYKTVSFKTNAGKDVSFKAEVKKTGGTLRERWDVGSITKSGETYSVEVFNPMEYASYVEFGHRTRNHKGWVPGQYMLTISEEEMKNDLERIIQNKLKEKFGIK